MADILILYSTTDGHCRTICLRLGDLLEGLGDHATVVDINDADALDLATFDKVIIGASIRYGKHQPVVARYIDQHQALLDSRPNAFFSVNLVARKPHKRSPQSNPYLRKFLSQIDWRPRHTDVFAGRLDYPAYGFWDRNIIRLIMWITGGPTDPSITAEFTDWEQVARFARVIQGL